MTKKKYKLIHTGTGKFSMGKTEKINRWKKCLEPTSKGVRRSIDLEFFITELKKAEQENKEETLNLSEMKQKYETGSLSFNSTLAAQYRAQGRLDFAKELREALE